MYRRAHGAGQKRGLNHLNCRSVKNCGLYDPTVASLVDLFGFTPRFSLRNYRPQTGYDREKVGGVLPLPRESDVQALRSLTDFSYVMIGYRDGADRCEIITNLNEKQYELLDPDRFSLCTALNGGGHVQYTGEFFRATE